MSIKNYTIGQDVKIVGPNRFPIAVGTVIKITKRQVTVAIDDTNTIAKYYFDLQYGSNEYKRYSIHGDMKDKYALRFSFIEPIKKGEVERVRQEAKQRAETLRQQTEEREAERKAIELAKEKERKKNIEAFWESEGKDIWNARTSISLVNGIELTVIQRSGEKKPNGYFREGKVLMCELTPVKSISWRSGEEIEMIHVERGGIEIHERSGEETKYPSFWGGSSYDLPANGEWMKELVYNELGRY